MNLAGQGWECLTEHITSVKLYASQWLSQKLILMIIQILDENRILFFFYVIIKLNKNKQKICIPSPVINKSIEYINLTFIELLK